MQEMEELQVRKRPRRSVLGIRISRLWLGFGL